jgi:hypothetical protein
MKKEIVYPFFIECCKYTNDKYWKSIFEDLAYAVTPYGVYINKDFLTCNYKEKEFSYKIQKKNSEELYNEIYSIFKNKLGLVSRDEIIKKQNVIDNMKEDVTLYTDWSNIKKKNIKEIMIENFAISMKGKYNLSLSQTRYLVSIIFLAFIFKVISSNDIIISNGQIDSINGIEFENGKIIMEKDIYDMNATITPEIIIEKKLMSDEWYKYVIHVKKSLEK